MENMSEYDRFGGMRPFPKALAAGSPARLRPGPEMSAVATARTSLRVSQEPM
jgi:hypothetical protein